MGLLGDIPVLGIYFQKLEEKVADFLDKTIEEHFLSYFLYEFKVEELKKSAEKLQEKKDEIERMVDDEYRHGKRHAKYVSDWLKEVTDIMTKNDEFWKDNRLPYTVCSKWYLPKPGMRYRLAKKAYKLVRQVDNLGTTTSFSDGVSSGLWPMSIDFLLFDVNFEIFDSRRQVTEDITKALKDTSIKKVGVYGMGGVGKTTLVKEVAKEARRLELFDVVIFATVTRTPDIKQIQGQLADQLGARLSEESEIGRASRLRDILKKEKKNILVVLDDLWAELDLNKLGIPIDDVNLSPDSAMNTSKKQKSTQEEGTTKKQMSTQEEGTSANDQAKKEATNDSKMLKILLTSRSKEVVRDKMHVKENLSFPIEGLNEKEAEVLFKKMAGMADKHPDFGPLATKISKRCGGLPIAIVTIGKTLRTKSYSQWNDTLGQLEQQEFTEDLSTKLSFKYLENEELKSTFLLCAQLGYHPLIMELVKYCVGVGIFEGFHTIKETREKVLRLIEKLKDSSLLLDSYSDDRFNMHDLIRDSALSISSQERHFFTMRNGKLKEWPHENKFKKYNGISICKCDIIDKLPNSVSCPRLEIFRVDSPNPSFNIPKDFFERARQLRALILTGIDVSKFCASIGCLKNLRMLCLEKCKLDDISFIGKLEKLRILSLSGSIIENLPTELGKLHKLQLLDISNCSELKILPNALSRLESLEELYMRNSVKWEREENQSENNILAELRHLHELKNLDICLPNVAILPRNLFLNKLESYKIVIGDIENLSVKDFKMPVKDEVSKVLALQINDRNAIHYQKGWKMLFRGVEKMLLGQLSGVRNIFCELNLEGFPCLKELWIIDNPDIECIIDPKELLIINDVFPILESLYLHKLRNVKKVISHDANLSGTSFLSLKVVRIHSCAQLENVFSSSMVELLKNLEAIDISDCKSMKTIVEKNDERKINFPKLRSLALDGLRNFTGVYSNDHGGNNDFILLNGKVDIPNLESLELSSLHMKEMSSQSKPFEKLTKLNVTKCYRIRYLFSSSMAKSMKKLKRLSVSECIEMEEIFKYETQENVAREVRVFPKLEEIHLNGMPSLKVTWPGECGPDSFTSLNSMFIEGCNKLVTVLPSHMVGKFGKLESLKIVSCDSVEQIFDLNGAKKPSAGNETHLQVLQIHDLRRLKYIWNGDPAGILNFKRLHSIEVSNCHKLEYLFPISMAKGLQELNSLSVSYCPQMEEIAHGDEGLYEKFEFPQVSVVKMKRLRKLKCFFKGKQRIEWPKLKRLSVFGCNQLEAFKTEAQNSNRGSIFVPEEIIPNLETMQMSLKEVEKLKLCIKNYRMNHLKNFHVDSCPSIEILNQFLYRMPYLERLTLFDCDLKELIPIEENICSGNPDIQETIGTFLQLKYLELRNLGALENIGFERSPDLQYYLEHLVIWRCDKLNNLGPSSVTLTHLTTLEVRNCWGMKNLMGISTAKSLVQLESLKVFGCKRLEQIVARQKDEVQAADKLGTVFSKLMTLELHYLPKLSCFCSYEIHHSMEFPSLEKLMVNDCPRMTRFYNLDCTAPNLKVIVIDKEEENWSWKGNLNRRIRKTYKSWLSDGTLLSLFDHYSELADIWDRKIRKIPEGREVESFKNLKTLVVENCELPSTTVIPSHLFIYLPRLYRLEVRSCTSVVAIFDVNEDVIVESSELRVMILDNLPNMKHVWSKNPEGILSFERLEKVWVTDCDSLQTLFPAASITKSLLRLEIKNCGALEEIIGKVEAYEERAVVEEHKFPSLASLRLGKLPKLKCGSMKLRCPSLKCLKVYDCGKFTKSHIFASESQSYQGANVEDQIDTSNDSHSIFTVKQVSCLKEVSLTKEEAIIFCNNADTPADVLSGLTDLQLHCFHNNVTDETDTSLPFQILQKLPNVYYLSVACSDLSEIFPPTLDPGFVNRLKLKGLRLEYLPELNSIGIEHASMNSLQQNLTYLAVERCPCLAKLVESPVTFSNLNRIYMSKCHGLGYIFTTSTARALPNLSWFRVYDCEAIKEIVARAEEDGMDPGVDIIFERLRILNLSFLPSLARFYAGTSTLKFPDMCEVEIAQCPNMNSFSQGLIIAPKMLVDDIPPRVKGGSWRCD